MEFCSLSPHKKESKERLVFLTFHDAGGKITTKLLVDRVKEAPSMDLMDLMNSLITLVGRDFPESFEKHLTPIFTAMLTSLSPTVRFDSAPFYELFFTNLHLYSLSLTNPNLYF